MRLVPKSWHSETWVCSIRGHVAPATKAATLREVDRELGVDTHDGRRLSRCLRCDTWIDGYPPPSGQEAYATVPPLAELDLPRRGKPLADAILLRLIAIDRAIHAVLFGLLAVLLILVDTNLGNLHSWANRTLSRLTGVTDDTGQDSSRDWLGRQLQRLANLDKHTVTVLAFTAVAYCVIEGIEAVGLWRERRWAEYLTAIATAGFLPFEIKELLDRVTLFRLGALAVNVAILVWLVWNKRLFGLRGGAKALQEDIDWNEVLEPPKPPRGRTLEPAATPAPSG
jgi:uncharacterized membrane protein (DUF2068 family)